MSPTQRSLQWLREHGYEPTKTEYWHHYAKVRKDLFGFIDILAVSEHHLLAIQNCAGEGGDHAARVRKIKALPVARLLACHMDIEVWSWAKRGGRGAKKEWTLRRTALTALLLSKRRKETNGRKR